LPHNNALTVIDFDVKEIPNPEGTMTVVTPRLVAHNIQIIANANEQFPLSFTP